MTGPGIIYIFDQSDPSIWVMSSILSAGHPLRLVMLIIKLCQSVNENDLYEDHLL